MRRLSASFFTSLDGVIDAPQEWHFPFMSEQMVGVIGELMTRSDAILLGRATYEEWASHWPNQPSDGGMTDFLNNTPKYVASTTLADPEWQSTTVIRDDVCDAVAELKQQAGRDIFVNGSGTLVRCLLREGLVDELRLMVHPVLVGRGKHLFEGGIKERPLRLVASETLSTGVINLTYEPLADGASDRGNAS